VIQIEKKHLEIVLKVLSMYPYAFYAYGSRVKGTASQFSDLDLCYQENIPTSITRKIKEEFQESNLPFRVEIVN
jgi:predicted nucleotidyltransferase